MTFEGNIIDRHDQLLHFVGTHDLSIALGMIWAFIGVWLMGLVWEKRK